MLDCADRQPVCIKMYYWVISPFCNMTLHFMEPRTNVNRLEMYYGLNKGNFVL